MSPPRTSVEEKGVLWTRPVRVPSHPLFRPGVGLTRRKGPTLSGSPPHSGLVLRRRYDFDDAADDRNLCRPL